MLLNNKYIKIIILSCFFTCYSHNIFAMTALQKHVVFFDRNHDGKITLSETFSSSRLLGFGYVRSGAMAFAINNALGIVGQLRGVSYKWLKDGKPSIGVIAQEVEEVIPEVVKTTEVAGLDGMEEVKSVDYGRLVGVLINAINELKSEVDELKGGK